MQYFTFPINGIPEDNTQFATVLAFGTHTVLCRFYFDIDDISDTFNHWICCMDITDLPDESERSFVLNPNCLYFTDDEIFTVAVRTDELIIDHNRINNVTLLIGVPD